MERAISPHLGSVILVRFPLVFHVYMYFKCPVLTSQTDKTDFPPAFLRDQQQKMVPKQLQTHHRFYPVQRTLTDPPV